MEFIKDAAVLALLVILFRKKVQIGHVFMVSALLFGLLHHLGPLQLGRLVLSSLTDPSSLNLFAALYLIIVLEAVMRRSGLIDRLVSGMKNLSGDPRFPMAALPAIIGLLPSPGGARLSAPLVEEAARELDLPGEQNAAINYYYRHIWEYFLPMYPAVLLAVEILNVSLGKYILIMSPFTIVTVLAGLVLFKNVPAREKKEAPPRSSTQNWKQVLEGLAPVAAVVILVLLVNINVLIALLLVVTFIFVFYKIEWPSVPPILKGAFQIRLLYMVFGAIYLQDVLVASGSIDRLAAFSRAAGLSPLFIAVIFPLLVGLLTGVTIAGVSIALPIIVTLAGPANLLALGSAALASNMVGVMLSPMHLCLVMSVEHFSADFGRSYFKFLLPEVLVIVFALIYAQVL
ncbi:MAG: DUF401 family protein [Peptococcaceae bacterium]|jgi:integral membrane protein (TIGR00529 family)|nr:DUF401 family protein [Peptococcaceae bacterium]MDH7526322.1 DUF401 family protein [Peptococcaceae bacterium]